MRLAANIQFSTVKPQQLFSLHLTYFNSEIRVVDCRSCLVNLFASQRALVAMVQSHSLQLCVGRWRQYTATRLRAERYRRLARSHYYRRRLSVTFMAWRDAYLHEQSRTEARLRRGLRSWKLFLQERILNRQNRCLAIRHHHFLICSRIIRHWNSLYQRRSRYVLSKHWSLWFDLTSSRVR
jgi:hypothetical protein